MHVVRLFFTLSLFYSFAVVLSAAAQKLPQSPNQINAEGKRDDTDLVVLSACETGLGELGGGEGVYGLQRALKIAGAKTTLMSLWKVDDVATQRLKTLFYQQYTKTNDARISFRKAQDELRKKYPEPYYWGAFVMVGK
jgi:CHAT domain-containing protein